MGIFHKFVSAAADDPDSTDVPRPSDWNDDHLSPPHVLMTWSEATGGDIWADMPAALTEFFGDVRSRIVCDLRFATTIRMIVDVQVAGASGAELRAQYSINSGSSWAYLSTTNGPAQAISKTGLFASPLVTIVPAARVDPAWVRLVGIGGNGVADPKLRSVALHYR
jgi:hypothetical protein